MTRRAPRLGRRVGARASVTKTTLGGGLHCFREKNRELGRGAGRRSRPSSDQIRALRDAAPTKRGHDRPEAPAQPVPGHGRADRPTDAVGDPGRPGRQGRPGWLGWSGWLGRGPVSRRVGDEADGERPASGWANMAEGVEGPSVPDPPDQAESRVRPLRRRARTMARPARVDMRCRNPCRLARRRLLGWNGRFTHRLRCSSRA